MNKIEIPMVWTDLAKNMDLKPPVYATTGSAGIDLQAVITEPMTIRPGERELVSSGISMALPEGFEAQIRPRSGLALKHGITVLNTPGTVDADYRGEVKVMLINLGKENFVLEPGVRMAQMVIAPVTQANLHPVVNLDETERGVGGFGSTGMAASG